MVVVQAELEALQAIAIGGKVDVPVAHEVRRFSHVMHLYSVLEAKVAGGQAGWRGCSPPSRRPPLHRATQKLAAARIGRDVESKPRGPYGGHHRPG